jgi:hypothetical protein
MKEETTKQADKPKCKTCKKPKEVEIATELKTEVIKPYTPEELELVMSLVLHPRPTIEQTQFLVDFNNRVLNDNKRMGCGKCVVQVKKNLINFYNREMAGL